MEDRRKFTKEMVETLRSQAWEVLSDMGVRYSDCLNVFSRKRGTKFVVIRKAVARRMRAMGYTFPDIGHALGRDHSTIIHYIGGGQRESE